MSWHEDEYNEQYYLPNNLNCEDEIYNESQMIQNKVYNRDGYNFDSQQFSNRENHSKSISENGKNHNNTVLPTSSNQHSFDFRRSRSKFASLTNPLIYAKLFKQVKLYETNQKRISQRFHQYKHLFPTLKDQEIIELIKDQFKQQKHKFQCSGKDPKKQYQDIINKHCITKQIEQKIMKGYIKYEGDLQRICYEFRSKEFIHLQKNSIITFPTEHIVPRQLQLILIVKIKASICKLQQLIRQKRLAKIFIPFNELQLNQIAYRFLEVHKGKVYSMDKALPIVSFSVIFSTEFTSGKIMINQKEAFNLYKFMVNVLSAVQSQTYFKKEKLDIHRLNNNNSITYEEKITNEQNGQKQPAVLNQNLCLTKKLSNIKSQHNNSVSLNTNETILNSKQNFNQLYIFVVRFYLQCGDWKKVVVKLLQLYGTQFKYFKWSVLQRKVQSFLRVVYQLFLSRLTEQNNLLQYKKQLPLQSRIKFIHITTWRMHQSLLFMLFYFYIHGNQLQPYHFKEIINYFTINKHILCSNKKEMPHRVGRDVLKIEQQHGEQIMIEKIKDGHQQQSNDMFKEKGQYKLINDNNEKNEKQDNKKYGDKKEQQKIQLKEAKNDKFNFKQIKENDQLLFPRPSYTLEEKLNEYRQRWKQQATKSIKMKQQMKKQPMIWMKMQKISQLSGCNGDNLNSQQEFKHQGDNFILNQKQQSQSDCKYLSSEYNDEDQSCFSSTQYRRSFNTTQPQYKPTTYKGFNNYQHQKANHYSTFHQPRQQSLSFNNYHQHRQQSNNSNCNKNPNPNFERQKNRSRKQFLQQTIRDKLKQRLNNKKTNSKRYGLHNDKTTTQSDRLSIHQAYSQTICCKSFCNINDKIHRHERASLQQEQIRNDLYGPQQQYQSEQFWELQQMDELEQEYQGRIIIRQQQVQKLQQQLCVIDSYEYLLEQDEQHMLSLNHQHNQHNSHDIDIYSHQMCSL